MQSQTYSGRSPFSPDAPDAPKHYCGPRKTICPFDGITLMDPFIDPSQQVMTQDEAIGLVLHRDPTRNYSTKLR